MSEQRFLVTGALGCIGAWVVKRLVDEATPVWTYDLGTSNHRLRLIMDDEAMAQVNFVQGDITDFDAFDRVVADNGITHIVHLAAFQVPFVRAEPVLGARVNLVGMSVVLESARRHLDQLRGLAYASSIAVYDHAGAAFFPATLYGVHKIANEGMARIYSQDYGLHSIGLRPHTVYGPGRDQGMTSSPTKAMLAAAAGLPYHITFGGTIVLQHVDDMAKVFIDAARSRPGDASVYDVGGSVASVEAIMDAILQAAPDMASRLDHDPTPLPVSTTAHAEAIEAVIKTQWRPLADGVRDTVEQFRAAIAAGRIDVERAMA
ncbi:MAG: NAD(P)-dependent oxidoreductase [Anaerolineae bacterium]|nr:NAD(P)-dependent oxidoreductase [Anaerolineae bacterium]